MKLFTQKNFGYKGELIMHRFILTDLNGVEFMSTEVDAFDPSIDAEFWETFMGGECAMVYLGEFKEED